jgi:glutamyl-tRNA synthetase
MLLWKAKIEELELFDAANIELAFKNFITEQNLGIGAVLPLFRLLLTGAGMGPSMFEISSFLGKEETLARITIGLEKLS